MENFINHFTDIFIKLLSLWPYLALTIPFAVAMNLTGGGEYIGRITNKRPFVAIFLATSIGAFSPLCSCGIIPVIASLLLGGAPIAPVMSFWIASPSMDPEIFFLSAGLLGWELAIWRMAATLVMSLLAGFITHYLSATLIGREQVLSRPDIPTVKTVWKLLTNSVRMMVSYLYVLSSEGYRKNKQIAFDSGPGDVVESYVDDTIEHSTARDNTELPNTSCADDQCRVDLTRPVITGSAVLTESLKASWMVLKFMLLAIVLQTLISTLISPQAIQRLLSGESFSSLGKAAIISIPFYTSNLTALPLMSSLIDQGLNPAIALVFLIAGPTTTLPAMAAVWGLVNRRIFVLYVSVPFVTAIIAGSLYRIFQ